LLAKEHYDESYRIVSDWAFFMKLALADAKFVHRPVTVGCFDMSGISTMNQDLLHEERERVAQSLLPQCVRNDFDEIDELQQQLTAYEVQMDKQLKEVYAYRNKRKGFRRLLNVYLRLVKLVDKI
jgi:hypothetical protein